MAALRKKVVVGSAIGNGLSNQFLAAFVTLTGIDHIQPGIERAFKQATDRFLRRALKTNFGAAETKDRDLHVGFAELPLFHASIVGRFWETPISQSYKTSLVCPVPVTICPIRFAFSMRLVLAESFSLTMATIPTPMLKT